MLRALAAAVVAVAITAGSVPAAALAINWDEAPVPVPALALEPPEGGAVGLDAYAGSVVILNLWATWCAPCKREMPTLAALQREFDPANVRVVALAVDRAGFDDLRAFLAELDAGQLTLLRDADGDAARALGAPGLPVTLVIDRAGRERFRHAGYADWSTDAVADALADLAAE